MNVAIYLSHVFHKILIHSIRFRSYNVGPGGRLSK